MSPQELDNKVYDILCELTTVARADLRPEFTLSGDLGMDSVSAMEMLGMLDEALGVEIDIEDTFSVKTVEQVLELVRARVPRAAR
jgi:acyl carrier protein